MRRVLIRVVLGGTALVIGACGSSSSAGRSTTTTTTTEPRSTTSTSATATTSGTCQVSQLNATVTTGPAAGSGAGGFEGGLVTFMNKSDRTCTLAGYPGMEALDASGKAITNASRGCIYLACGDIESSEVAIPPDGTAFFYFDYRDNPENGQICPTAASALVTPPNDYEHFVLALHIAICGIPPQLAVAPVSSPPTLGRSGVYPYSTGFGEVTPSSVFLGGEAESAVSQITWASWGDAQATGTGTGCYYAATTPAYECSREQVTLYAFDLGECQGTFMYQMLEYVFLEEGQTFDPNSGMNICTDQ